MQSSLSDEDGGGLDESGESEDDLEWDNRDGVDTDTYSPTCKPEHDEFISDEINIVDNDTYSKQST